MKVENMSPGMIRFLRAVGWVAQILWVLLLVAFPVGLILGGLSYRKGK